MHNTTMRALVPSSETDLNGKQNSTPLLPAQAKLALVQLPTPTISPDEVLIDVHASGINRADLLQAAGHYPPPPKVSPALGLECAGTLIKLGKNVPKTHPHLQIGDKVCALVPGGGCADLVSAPANTTLKLPHNIDPIAGASLIEAMATAWLNLVELGGLPTTQNHIAHKDNSGPWVLIHGGSGGVGSIAIQIGAALGAKIITTAGSAARAQKCVELGANLGINYNEDLQNPIGEVTGARGVDLILDVTGAGGLQGNIELLAKGGKLVIIGLQRGRKGELDLLKVLAKNLTITGTTLRTRSSQQKAKTIIELRKHIWPLLENGKIKPIVHASWPLEESAQAHLELKNGHAFGKIVLTHK